MTTDNEYIKMSYDGGFQEMPNILVSEIDKSQADSIYINSSFAGKILVNNIITLVPYTQDNVTTAIDPAYSWTSYPITDSIEIPESIANAWIASFGGNFENINNVKHNISIDDTKTLNRVFEPITISGETAHFIGNGHFIDSSKVDTEENFCFLLGASWFLVTRNSGLHSFGITYEVV